MGSIDLADSVDLAGSAGIAGRVGSAELSNISVVADRWFGPDDGRIDPGIGERLCQLAEAAHTVLLDASLQGSGKDVEVVSISAWPNVADPAVAEALTMAMGAA
jgi:hypothetical protein